MKPTLPLAFKTTVPPVPLVTEPITRVALSGSLSLPSSAAAVKVAGVSSVAASVSAVAIGASLTGVRSRLALPTALALPSPTL